MADLNALSQAVITGNLEQARMLTQTAIDEGVAVESILNDALIAAMKEVGEKFKNGDFFVPEMLIAARAMNGAMYLLEPKLVEAGVEPCGTVVLGTVKGDLHDIGKNLVCMMLEGAGFEIVDLGTDVAPERFIDAVKNQGVDIIAMSALLTTTMPNMKNTIDALKEAGLRDKVKVMIGGAPVTQAYADEIGADGYAPDASRAAALARTLMGV